MPWVRIDDGVYDHPKFVGLSFEASGVWLHTLAWSARQLTDGKLPRPAVQRLLAGDRRLTKIARELVAAGLWDETPDGWEIHDFHDYQPTAAGVEEERRKARERQAKHRTNKGRFGRESRRESRVTGAGSTHADDTVDASTLQRDSNQGGANLEGSTSGRQPDGGGSMSDATPTTSTNGAVSRRDTDVSHAEVTPTVTDMSPVSHAHPDPTRPVTPPSPPNGPQSSAHETGAGGPAPGGGEEQNHHDLVDAAMRTAAAHELAGLDQPPRHTEGWTAAKLKAYEPRRTRALDYARAGAALEGLGDYFITGQPPAIRTGPPQIEHWTDEMRAQALAESADTRAGIRTMLANRLAEAHGLGAPLTKEDPR